MTLRMPRLLVYTKKASRKVTASGWLTSSRLPLTNSKVKGRNGCRLAKALNRKTKFFLVMRSILLTASLRHHSTDPGRKHQPHPECTFFYLSSKGYLAIQGFLRTNIDLRDCCVTFTVKQFAHDGHLDLAKPEPCHLERPA
jgi:hypothetical protein